MFEKKYFYLIKLQYLGYRFHGWQKQPSVKTLHLMVDRTLKYILEDKYFKTLAAGRTDAMVSAEGAAMELFLKHKIENEDSFLELFNRNLPQDIRALEITEVNEGFNIINNSKTKEYWYLFSEGSKNHPFCSPIMTTILDSLDIEMMKKGAKLFEGTKNFKNYCYKPSENGVFERTIISCSLVDNTDYVANFFPKKSYILKVVGKGFARNQIRLMMGTLLSLGRNEINLEFVENSFCNNNEYRLNYIAPASGLIMKSCAFEF